MVCYHCGGEIKIEGYISRMAECPNCAADVHCCLNCENYDPAAYNRCREPQAEWVSDREKANFCDYFTPNRLMPSSNRGLTAAEEARRAFENLFKK
jgi:hypothetical protein